MSQINLDDSDCIIEENNITCITLDDSQEIIDDVDDDVPPPPPAMDDDMEEGEVSEDENDVQKQTICEIKFPTKQQFESFGQMVINTLKKTLGDSLSVGTIEITEDYNQDYVTLSVQHVAGSEVEEIPMPPPLTSADDIPMPPPLKIPDNSEKNTQVFEKATSPDLTGLSELFTIDTAPAPKIDSVKVPSYKRAIKDALLDEEAAAIKRQKEEKNVFKARKTNICFNCGESGHSIKECPKPHNAKRIKIAKRQCFKTERYHVDVEQRFAHIKPGCISDKLREALSLRKGEIPFFFYRMRVLGYPPGWLEEAKVEQSGINLFNSDGAKILHSDEDDGEIDAVNHKYNISKIHEFPGFNQNPGENFYDDYKYHNVPPLGKHHMKEEFIKTLGDNILKGYKRKKLKEFPDAPTDDLNVGALSQEATDMEIEDSEVTTTCEVQFSRPPPPADEPPSPPPPPVSPPPSCESPAIVSGCEERDVATQSPSLLELVKQKKRLLKELKSNSSVIEIEDSLIDDIIELDEEDDKRTNEPNISDNKNSENDNQMTVLNEPKLTSNEPKVVIENESTSGTVTAIKESFMGTPVLKFSPYDILPNGENFKVGVSDVINFENLPDSTGKYEKMKEVIKKVRNCISKLHSEE